MSNGSPDSHEGITKSYQAVVRVERATLVDDIQYLTYILPELFRMSKQFSSYNLASCFFFLRQKELVILV